MMKTALRFAAVSVLMSATLAAHAGPGKKEGYQNFELSGTLQELVGPSLTCPSKIGGTIMGYGSSDLLGKVGFLSSDCITPNGTSYTFSNGKFMITTMTGELLFASYGGDFVPTGEGTKFVFSNASFTITGGTGRYFKATGSGTLSGGEDMANGQGTIKLNGRLLLK